MLNFGVQVNLKLDLLVLESRAHAVEDLSRASCLLFNSTCLRAWWLMGGAFIWPFVSYQSCIWAYTDLFWRARQEMCMYSTKARPEEKTVEERVA
jgi:hypothetical protein